MLLQYHSYLDVEENSLNLCYIRYLHMFGNNSVLVQIYAMKNTSMTFITESFFIAVFSFGINVFMSLK